MSVQVEVNGEILELYQDEGLNLVKKALSYEKVGSSWSDYSQAFAVPASKVNNKIFEFYFNPDVIGGFDPFAINDCKIFIEGQIQYEGTIRIVNIKFKDSLPLLYNVQFFSNTIRLTEALKDKTIADIDWSSYNHTVTASDTQGYLSGTPITGDYAEDLYYPFISVKSLLRWDNPNGLQYKPNVSFASASSTGVLFDEFRPAAPISLIVRELFTLAGYEVENNLIGNEVYDKAYIWLNNTETLTGVDAAVQESIAQLEALTVISKDDDLSTRLLRFSNEVSNDGGFMENGGFRIPKTETYVFTLNSVPNSFNIRPYRYRMHINKVEQSWRTMAGTRDEQDVITIALTANDSIYFEFEPTETDTIYFQQWTSFKVQSQSAFLSDFVVSKYVPKIDASKFIQGVLDMFNALIYLDNSTGKFVIQNRQDWLNSGTTYDFSKYIDTSSKLMKPPTFFNDFEFAMGESEDISSTLYRDLYGKNYGTTTYNVGNVYGESYSRSIPFTLPFMQLIQSDQEDASAGAFATENLVTTTSVDKAYESINPNGFIMIKEGTRGTTGNQFKIIDYIGNSASSTITNDFRTDTITGKTISFSTILNAEGTDEKTDTLFFDYYSDFINNLYNQSVRRYQFKAYIPLNIISYLNLNDEILINYNTYTIEDIRINTNTGLTTLNLITRI